MDIQLLIRNTPMMESKSKDFIFSIFLAALGGYVIYEGMKIYRYAANPPFKITNFSISPAFLPVVLGAVLIFLSILLFFQSLKGSAFSVSIKERGRELRDWIKTVPQNRDIFYMGAGMAIMGIYIFILMKFLPFWISSIIYLAGLLIFLRVGKIWKILIITGASVGGVVLLFQVIFRASLP
ncbi:tripartite tricarboxylate transporter TctB family protein [Treponema sp. OttesenSCG-928-L16]|nr:tripartite tricarboxylate transporter TctB family protein [Treponema sp. OttesenSCG-928-L16]